MKNKYFDELQEMGILDDEDEEEKEPEYIDPDLDESYVPKTVRRVITCMIFFFILEELLTLFLIGGVGLQFSKLKYQCLLGLLAGTVIGIFNFLFMKKQIEEITELDEKSANARIRLGAVARIFIIIAVLAACLITKFMHPIAVILGVMNLKVAALVQPFLDNFNKKA